jgi:hypothetical protein
MAQKRLAKQAPPKGIRQERKLSGSRGGTVSIRRDEAADVLPLSARAAQAMAVSQLEPSTVWCPTGGLSD